MGESTSHDLRHEALAVVLQVRAGGSRCSSGSAARSRSPAPGPCPAATSSPGETLEHSIRRHLAAKVDVREVAHLEQLETLSEPERHPGRGFSQPPTSASSRKGSTRRYRPTPRGIRSTTCRSLRSTTARSCSPAASGSAPSSPTRTSASRSRPRRSRSRSSALSTARRSVTTSPPRTSSASCCAGTSSSRPARARGPGRAGGRPAAVYRFRSRELEVTDQFAVLRPPGGRPKGSSGLQGMLYTRPHGLDDRLVLADPEDPGRLSRVGDLVGRQGSARSRGPGSLRASGSPSTGSIPSARLRAARSSRGRGIRARTARRPDAGRASRSPGPGGGCDRDGGRP